MNYIVQRTIELINQTGSSYYLERPANPLNEEDLELIESKLNCQLPLGYREFLRNFGQGDIGFYCEFDYEENGESKSHCVSDFYGFYRLANVPEYETCRDIIQGNLDFEPEKANDVICIGSDPGDYQICVCVRGNHFGSVYFWDRGKAWEASGVEDLDLIATSFEEFLGKLRVVH